VRLRLAMPASFDIMITYILPYTIDNTLHQSIVPLINCEQCICLITIASLTFHVSQTLA
jgi:hypothetical protein